MRQVEAHNSAALSQGTAPSSASRSRSRSSRGRKNSSSSRDDVVREEGAVEETNARTARERDPCVTAVSALLDYELAAFCPPIGRRRSSADIVRLLSPSPPTTNSILSKLRHPIIHLLSTVITEQVSDGGEPAFFFEALSAFFGMLSAKLLRGLSRSLSYHKTLLVEKLSATSFSPEQIVSFCSHRYLMI